MSDSPARRELFDLLEALLNGQLDASRHEHLQSRLKDDAEAQRLYLNYLDMHLALTRLSRRGEQDFEPGPAISDPGPPAAARRFPRPPSRGGRWETLGIAASLLIAAAVAITAAVAIRNRPANPVGGSIAVATPDPKVNLSGGQRDIPSLIELALVIGMDSAQWESGDGPAPSEGGILKARRLQLHSGRATLAFLSGVMLTLEGPADVDLVSIDRVFCRRGKLRARVPRGAEGFVVASPGSAVIDMGTEFALNVESDGRSRVMVFEGLAEAALLGSAGSPERTQLVERSQAFELDPRTGRIDVSDARPEGFVAAPDLDIPSLDLDPAYAAAVVESRPRSYWRFESLDGGAIPNEVPGGSPLRVAGPIGLSSDSQGNRHAVFKAGDSQQFLSTDDLWVLAREPGHAVEFWFLSEGISHASIVGLFPPKEYLSLGHHGRHVHTFLVELTARDRRSLYKPASVRFLHRWPLDTRIGNNIFSENVYVPRRWHHVLAQKNGHRLDLFFDGVLDHSMPLEPDHPNLSCRLVVGRRTPDPQELEDIRPFVGRLDELAIYDHPLTDEEVRRHYVLANPSSRID